MRTFIISVACVLTLSTVASGLAEYSATITRHLLLYGDLDLRGNPDVANSQSEITWLGTDNRHHAIMTWREWRHPDPAIKIMAVDDAGVLHDAIVITTDCPVPEVQFQYPTKFFKVEDPGDPEEGACYFWMGFDGKVRVRVRHEGITVTTELN